MARLPYREQSTLWTEITRVVPRNFIQVKDADGNRCVSISLHDLRIHFDAYMQGR